jgi:hypothetical protein
VFLIWDQAYWYGMFLLVWFLVQFFAGFVLNLDGTNTILLPLEFSLNFDKNKYYTICWLLPFLMCSVSLLIVAFKILNSDQNRIR